MLYKVREINFSENTIEELRKFFQETFQYDDEFSKFQSQEKTHIEVVDNLENKWVFENQYLYRDQIIMSVSWNSSGFMCRRMTHDEFYDLFTKW